VSSKQRQGLGMAAAVQTPALTALADNRLELESVLLCMRSIISRAVARIMADGHVPSMQYATSTGSTDITTAAVMHAAGPIY
jgi:hypothetical protein